MKILYVDDHAKAQDFFCEAIKKIDPTISCMTTSGGKEAALALLGADPIPDIVFLGHRLNDIHAKVILNFIKKHERLKAIRVIIYAAYLNQSDIIQFKKAGADHCMEMEKDFIRFCSSLSALLKTFNLSSC